ncbi:MAG: hypothetical protein RL234_86 [Pseudomonadota bacterium]
MRVMEIREFGAPEMLVKAERPDPVFRLGRDINSGEGIRHKSS